MGDLAVEVRGLGKQYRLGTTGTRAPYQTFRDALTRAVTRPFRRGAAGGEDFWALRDVSFEVRAGEVVGIIGRNGAGKSTLLKILSRITDPTEGEADIHGRVGSLLEVGTGFHPELTGRENVFLNGAILGMRRAEIVRKFDEIVAFAEIEKFIDTPVKFYSSGMYMRLAFAVAAHLEPEILIIDEVLAVGDAGFQKKCLGKMGEVAHGGRTVLFVSHNVGTVLTLCNSGLYLRQGRVGADGPIADVFSAYAADMKQSGGAAEDAAPPAADAKLKVRSVELRSAAGPAQDFDQRTPPWVHVEFDVLRPGDGYQIAVRLYHAAYGCVFTTSTFDANPRATLRRGWATGRHRASVRLPAEMLRGGEYWVTVTAAVPGREVLDEFRDEIRFTLHETDSPYVHSGEGRLGVVAPILEWDVQPG